MKIVSNIKAISALALISALATSLALAGRVNPTATVARVCPPNSKAYGKTLTEWMGIYWQWYYGTGGDMTQGKVGPVQLMPLPNGTQTGGSWAWNDPAVLVGQLEITLPPGTPFVLPQYSWVRERYEPGTGKPDDPPLSDEVALASGHPTLTIDGRPIITDANKVAFYVPATDFDPIVVYPAPNPDSHAMAAISYQGVAFVSPPLTPGIHVIHLYEPLIFEPGAYDGLPDGLGLIYDNTWIVTVKPK